VRQIFCCRTRLRGPKFIIEIEAFLTARTAPARQIFRTSLAPDIRIAAMSDQTDAETVFSVSFVSTTTTVDPAWIEYNGHLNMAYYNLLIDRAVDEAFLPVGLGPDYARDRGASFFIAEAHVRYLRELQAGDPVRVALRLVDHDEKRLHLYAELHHATDGWISATSEQLALHVDMRSRKVSPFPEDVMKRLASMKSAHNTLPPPSGLGRAIAMRSRRSAASP
jgi:acyl-CoA thioester hydrolase